MQLDLLMVSRNPLTCAKPHLLTERPTYALALRQILRIDESR